MSGYFSYCCHSSANPAFSVNPRIVCMGDNRTSSFTPNITPCSNSLKSSFFPILILRQDFTGMFTCLNASSCCNMIGWLDIYISKQLHRCGVQNGWWVFCGLWEFQAAALHFFFQKSQEETRIFLYSVMPQVVTHPG